MFRFSRLMLVSMIVAFAATSAFAAEKAPAKKTEETATIETALGAIKIRFFPAKAPGHVENFKKLARAGFYDGTTFHRVIPGFMIQGGDPNSKDNDRSNDGMGGPGYAIKAEFNDTRHKRGIVSMARSQNPDSAGSQFFICVADADFLDGQYTAFGEVTEGMDVADKIVSVKRDGSDNPLEKVVMRKVTVTGK
ncbi:MAG: peptidylprolyl isomerase [Nitrospinae bacterium]|nr:peptidylprolyl isomerase [Nitrospinota bacterium]